MMLEFVPEAAQEAAEATAHYEEMEPGLGVRFREELQSVVAAILSLRCFGDSVPMAIGA